MFRLLLKRLRRAPVAAGGKLRPSRDVLSAERDGVAVLLDLKRAVYIGLDEVGTTAWRVIEDGATVEAIAARVAEEYDAPAEVVHGDMQRFTDELRRRQLVVRA